MGRRKAPGLTDRGGIWHIDKKIRGQRLCESTGEHSLEKAEEYLAKRIEETRKALIYGERPRRNFRQAATKYLIENQHKRSIGDDALHLKHRRVPGLNEAALIIHECTHAVMDMNYAYLSKAESEAIAYVVHWTAFQLALFYYCQWIGKPDRFFSAAVALNWGDVPVMVAQVGIALLIFGGFPMGFGAFLLVALPLAYWLFVAHCALRGSIWHAVGPVAIAFGLGHLVRAAATGITGQG